MDPALILSAVALLGAPIAGWFALRGKKTEVASTNIENLTAGQLTFIKELRAENQQQRERISVLDAHIDKLREEIASLRAELGQTRDDLEEERAARRTGEDAGKLRQTKSENRMTNRFDGGVDLGKDETS